MKKGFRNRALILTLICLLVMALCSSAFVFAEELAPINISSLNYKNGGKDWNKIEGKEITNVDVTKELTFQVNFNVPAGLDNQTIIEKYLYKTNKILANDDTVVQLSKESTNTVGRIKIVVAANTLDPNKAYDIYFSADANGGETLLIDILPTGVTKGGKEEPVTPPVEKPENPIGETKTFGDIQNHWAKIYIESMATKGICSGKGEGKFAPNDNVTRAEFAAFMTRALGLTEKADASTFSDLVSGAWYEDEVLAAAKAGIISGYDGQFRPLDRVTKQDMAVMIFKAYDYLGVKCQMADLNFTDNDKVSDYAKKAIRACVGEKIVSGANNGDNTFRFEPKSNATRAQAMVMLDIFTTNVSN